jgi:hypothetical protein
MKKGNIPRAPSTGLSSTAFSKLKNAKMTKKNMTTLSEVLGNLSQLPHGGT